MSRVKIKCIGARCYFYVKSVHTGRISGWDAHVTGNRCKKRDLSLKYMANKGMTCPLEQDMFNKEGKRDE